MFRFRVRQLDHLGDLVLEEYFFDIDAALLLISDLISSDDFLVGDRFILEVLS